MPINIQWNAGTSSWQGESAGVSKSAGAMFNVAFPPTKTGVRVCFNNTNVFGVSYFDFTSTGNNAEPVTGAVGQSSGYHLQDSGSTCTAQIDADEPYEITIDSGVDDDDQ